MGVMGVPVAGNTYQPRIVRPGATASSAAVLTIVDPDEVRADGAAARETGVDDTWVGAPLVLATPGDWWLIWTITGPAAGEQVERIPVAPTPAPAGNAAGGFAYASTRDLAEYTGQAPPAGARRKLVAASREIDRLTITARYRTDEVTGLAVDADLRRALAEATCELVAWWAETGTDSGARSLYTSASIGGVSLGFGGKAAGSSSDAASDRIGPKVRTILAAAGLISASGVTSYG